MPVIFKGGTSGNREDALPPVPSKGSPQPVLDTAFHKRSGNIHFQAEHQEAHADHYQHQTPDFMPEGGNIPESSSDVGDQGAAVGHDESVFPTKGS